MNTLGALDGLAPVSRFVRPLHSQLPKGPDLPVPYEGGAQALRQDRLRDVFALWAFANRHASRFEFAEVLAMASRRRLQRAVQFVDRETVRMLALARLHHAANRAVCCPTRSCQATAQASCGCPTSPTCSGTTIRRCRHYREFYRPAWS